MARQTRQAPSGPNRSIWGRSRPLRHHSGQIVFSLGLTSSAVCSNCTVFWRKEIGTAVKPRLLGSLQSKSGASDQGEEEGEVLELEAEGHEELLVVKDVHHAVLFYCFWAIFWNFYAISSILYPEKGHFRRDLHNQAPDIFNEIYADVLVPIDHFWIVPL